jgi:hypothetical protein
MHHHHEYLLIGGNGCGTFSTSLVCVAAAQSLCCTAVGRAPTMMHSMAEKDRWAWPTDVQVGTCLAPRPNHVFVVVVQQRPHVRRMHVILLGVLAGLCRGYI